MNTKLEVISLQSVSQLLSFVFELLMNSIIIAFNNLRQGLSYTTNLSVMNPKNMIEIIFSKNQFFYQYSSK